MTKTKNESLPLIIVAAVVLIVGGASYWFFFRGTLSTDDVTTVDRKSDVIAEEAGARRTPEPAAKSSTEDNEVVARRFAAEPITKAPLARESRAPSSAPSTERMFLSCRLEGVAVTEVGSYRLQPGPIATPSGIYWAPPPVTSMPADGAPLELDVTGMRELIERTRGFFLDVSRASGAEHRTTFDLSALTRREEPGRILYDVVVAFHAVTLVSGRIVSSETKAVDGQLHVYSVDNGRPSRRAIRSSFLRLDGRFEFLLDRNKEWLIACSAAGYEPVSLRVPLQADTVFDVGTVTLSRGESISGIVTRLGVPQAGMRVRAVIEDFERARADQVVIDGGQATWRDGCIMWSDLKTTTGPDGSYRFTGLDRRRFEVTVESSDDGKELVHESLRARLRREIVASAVGVDLEMDGVKLSVGVRDEAGPLEEWLVSLTAPDGKPWYIKPLSRGVNRTVYVPADTPLDVFVSQDKYETFRGVISFPRSESSANYEVVMKAAIFARLCVHVRDQEQLGLIRLVAFVKAPLDGGVPADHLKNRSLGRSAPPNMFMSGSGDGRSFTFDDLALTKGRYEFLFLPDGLESVPDLIPVTMNVDIDPERLNTIEIIFRQGGHARFRARDGSGAHVEGKATIRDAAGNEFSADLNPTEPTPGALAVAGPLAIGTDRLSRSGPSTTRLPMLPGQYRLVVERPDGTKKAVPFEIKIGEVTNVVVDF